MGSPGSRKMDVVHIRFRNGKKEQIKKEAEEMTELFPYVCTDCERRYAKPVAQCPNCGGKVIEKDVTPSELIRRSYLFHEAITTMNPPYTYYDIMVEIVRTYIPEFKKIKVGDTDLCNVILQGADSLKGVLSTHTLGDLMVKVYDKEMEKGRSHET